MTLDQTVVAQRLEHIRGVISASARGAGRDPADVEILAAVKYVDRVDLPVLAAAGIRRVGENRAQALLEKQAGFEDAFVWDFIGHLQSRKVRDVVGRITLMHALAAESTARQIQERATTTQDALVEVNTARDPSKYGVAPDQLDRFLDLLATLDRVRVRGLMTMTAFTTDPAASRPAFAELRELADASHQHYAPRHTFKVLSMGTSQDYAAAVAEGATIVRLGSVLYQQPGG